MNCRQVMKKLSPLLDERLPRALVGSVRDHLEVCVSCQAEWDGLVAVQSQLRSLRTQRVPESMRRVVEFGVGELSKGGPSGELRSELERLWSRMRTTDRVWYLAKISGVAATLVFFFAIYSALTPIALVSDGKGVASAHSQNLMQDLADNVMRNLGYLPLHAIRRPISSSQPMINDLYLLNFGQNASRRQGDDSFSVVARVDRNGEATIRGVLEYPADNELLVNFYELIDSARYRPASLDGRAVDSHLVHTYNRISVYD